MKETIVYFYGRKSQEDDERQVYSIDKQEDLASSWEKRNEMKITEYFTEEKSAYSKKTKREAFKKMVTQAKKEMRKGSRVIIVAWKINRLTRNPRDNYIVEELLEQGCEFDFFEEPFSNDPAGRLVFRMFLAMSVHYSENLSSDIRGGQKTAVSNGFYPGNAKIGYLNKKSPLEPRQANPEEAWKIREIFERIADGEPTEKVKEWAIDIAKLKNVKGTVILHSSFYTLIKDPFYCGHFVWGKKLYTNGKHEKIISEKLFKRARDVIEKRKHTKVNNHHYLFGGLVKVDGVPLTCSTNRGIAYYRNKDTGFYIREDELEREFIRQIDTSKVSEATLASAKEMIKDILNIKEGESEGKIKLFDAEIGKLKKRKKNLDRKFLDDEISFSRFEKMESEINIEILNLEEQKKEENVESISEQSNLLKKAVEQLKTASQSYKQLSTRKKAQFIKSVLVELNIDSGNALFKVKKEAQALLELHCISNGGA